MLKTLVTIVFSTSLLLPAFALGQSAGSVIDVRQPAQIVSGGSARAIARGAAVASGDTIRTGASGQVQLQFQDETRIVVGPNSSLQINETLFRANGTARKFATSAVGGTFRFLSGKSPKRVYRIATPVATMGIRGTVFDFTVTAGRAADLLVFSGSVRFCAAGRRCAAVPGGCQMVAVAADGVFSQPQTAQQKRDLLIRRFPLLAGQANLQPPFRAPTEGCETVRLIDLPGVAEERDSGREEGGSSDNPADGPSDPGGGGGNPAE